MSPGLAGSLAQKGPCGRRTSSSPSASGRLFCHPAQLLVRDQVFFKDTEVVGALQEVCLAVCLGAGAIRCRQSPEHMYTERM